jgi:hypothetical protein
VNLFVRPLVVIPVVRKFVVLSVTLRKPREGGIWRAREAMKGGMPMNKKT